MAPLPPGTIPVTLDIIGMYTNVPVDEGLHAFAKLMEDRADKTIPTAFLLKLMKFVAESSVFVFDAELFLQLLGVAMGSRSSPTFACLFVGVLEALMLGAWEVRPPPPPPQEVHRRRVLPLTPWRGGAPALHRPPQLQPPHHQV
jgi:hypothetical protein